MIETSSLTLNAFEQSVATSLSDIKVATLRSLFSEKAPDSQKFLSALENSRKGLNFLELYLENSQSLTLSLSQSVIKTCAKSMDKGSSVRAIIGAQSGFAYCDSLDIKSIEKTIKQACAIRSFGKSQAIFGRSETSSPKPQYEPINVVVEKQISALVSMLSDLDIAARKDPWVQEVRANLSLSFKSFAVFATDGTEAYDFQPLISLTLSIQMEHEGRKESGFASSGGRVGFSFFSKERLDAMIEKANRTARTNLESISAPAGEMPVVLGPGWAGVLFHEAVGHALEGDAIRKKTSVFSNSKGEMIASELCTLIDTGLMPHRRGSISIDDEGTPAQETLLIEKGKLIGFLWDKQNAALSGTQSTGSARRESYAHMPLVRMRNTYLQSGESDPESLIKPIKRGIYAADFSGGQVDTTSGQFVFTASSAFLIEDGKITSPLKGVSLIGGGSEALKRINGVGNDGMMDDGMGTCGKDGQSVPVGVGQPSVSLSSMTVGGTSS